MVPCFSVRLHLRDLLSVHPCCCRWHSFFIFFLLLSDTLECKCAASLSICRWTFSLFPCLGSCESCVIIHFYPLLLLFRCSVVSNSSLPHQPYPNRLLCPWEFPGKNTGVGCHFLLQRIFPTHGLNLCLLLGRRIFFLPLSHLGSPLYILQSWLNEGAYNVSNV